jgi:peptide/nickel transport system permease protein
MGTWTREFSVGNHVVSRTTNLAAVQVPPSHVGRHRASHLLIRSLLRARLPVVGLVILLAIVLAAVCAPLIAPHDPEFGNLKQAKLPPAWQVNGDPAYPLGTDELGRDIASRVIFGARVSLLVGVTAVLIGGLLGVSLGLISGYYRGWVDDVIMRIGDIQLAFPFILFAIAVLAVLGPGLVNLIVVLGISSWVTYGRVVRSLVLTLRTTEFVDAARAIGVQDGRILLRHVLPNVLAPVIVIATFTAASTILTEAALSFLGLGVPPRVPTWGGMVASGRDTIQTGQWWMTIFPGLAIVLTVFGINVVGDWLRDYLDPRLRV